MIKQVEAGRTSLAQMEMAETVYRPATPGPCCKVVSWDAPHWAQMIARHLHQELVGCRPAWRIEVQSVAALSSLVSLDFSPRQDREAHREFLLLVVAAREQGIRRVYRHFGKQVFSRRAGLVVVDCRAENLRELCEAVQGMPRWPLGWLPTLDLGESPCRTFVRRLARMLTCGNKEGGRL